MFDKADVDAVLFDLDGTLMDTDDQKVEELARRLRRLRCPRADRVARRLVMAAETPTNLLVTAFDLLGLDAPLLSITDRISRWRGWRTPKEFRIISGVQEMLAALQGRYRLAVVTTRRSHDAEAFLDQHDLRDTFAVVVTGETTWRLKPHPAPVRYAAEHLGVPAGRCVMVGDTTVDVRSGRRAGAWAVGVLCGFGERRELERAGAHLILEHTPQIASLL